MILLEKALSQKRAQWRAWKAGGSRTDYNRSKKLARLVAANLLQSLELVLHGVSTEICHPFLAARVLLEDKRQGL